MWLEKHTAYCFDKFTVDPPGEGQVDVWYLPRDENGTLALPKAQRGQGDDPLKRWFEEAQADDPAVWSTMNLHCFWSNLLNKAKLNLDSPHNPENAVAPARTDEADATYEDVTDNTVPCVATAGADETLLPSDTDTMEGIVETTDGQGSIISLVHIQCMYKSSIPGTSGSINNCHVAIQAPLGWRISDQNKSDFCTLSSDKKHLVLNVRTLPALFDRNTPRELLDGGVFGDIYQNLKTQTEHPALTAMKESIDAVRRCAAKEEIMTPSFLMKIPLMCECVSICAIDGLHDRGTPPALVTAPAPVVR